LKYHQEVKNISGKSVQVVSQDFHAKILAGNLTTALVISGHRYIEKNSSNNKTTEQINIES
jgi:hypothetical protein